MMNKTIAMLLVTLLLFSMIVPAISSSSKDTKIVELKALVWDGISGTWKRCASADKGDIIRFNISITYHDPDGEGISYKIKWITVVDKLPDGLEYLHNSTVPESNISGDGKTIIWSNMTDVELFDNETFSIEFDVKVLDNGVQINIVNVSAFETCPHVWHSESSSVIVYTTNNPKSRDTDSDRKEEFAFDRDENIENGYEFYIDPDFSSDAVLSIDGDNDSKIDHFIDTDRDGLPNRYWDPDDDILCDIIIKDVDGDGTKEWVYDSDGDGRLDRYYDPDDGKIHPYSEEEDITIEIVRPLRYYLYVNGEKKRRMLFRTIVVGPIEVEANASDNVERVEFYIDGKLEYVDNETPYTWNWSTSSPLIGRRYTLEVRAYDASGSYETAKLSVWRYRFSNPILFHPAIGAGTALLLAKLLKNLKSGQEPTQPPKPKDRQQNVPPVAEAGGPYSGYVNNAIQFNASGSYDQDGNIVSYMWDFGDGSTGAGEYVSHVYKNSGRYDVKLTVTDDDGATSTDKASVMVKDIPVSENKNIEPFWYAVAGLSLTLLTGLAMLFFRRDIFE